MTLRSVDNAADSSSDDNPLCPICGGEMKTVYDRHHQRVCVCVDCHTGLTIPPTAANVARIKRERNSA